MLNLIVKFKKVMKKILLLSFLFISCFAQNIVDISLIDAYVKPEQPQKLIIFFYSSDSVKSKIVINEKYDLVVSDSLKDEHKFEYEIENMNLKDNILRCKIYLSYENNEYFFADSFQVKTNYEIKGLEDESYSLFKMCCLGGTVFGMPNPSLVIRNGKEHLSLSKEIALFTFYSNSYKYPAGYVALGYTFIDKSNIKHLLRIGYKHIFDLPVIEYISPGLGIFTDFKGNYGATGDIALGLLKISNNFTFYGQYRFNYIINEKTHFHEISIGLYSSFFSINF